MDVRKGDAATGFRFEDSSGIHWNPAMEETIGRQGRVADVRPEINEVDIVFPISEKVNNRWCFPLDQHKRNRREQKLNEIGIA